MPGNPVHAVAGVSDRVRALGTRSAQLVALRDRLSDELVRKQTEVEGLSDQIEKLSKVGELFRLLMDLLVDKQVRVVEGVVTEGLQSIFHDLGLSFEAEVTTKYHKVAVDFYMRQGSKEDPLSHRGKPVDSFGGGPSSVASLILRILTVLRLKRYPVLVLDEALAAVSDEYTDQTGRFLASLASKMGIDVLLVTHKPAFLEHADTAYRCEEIAEPDGTRRLNIRSLK